MSEDELGLFAAMSTTRAIRRFRPEPVPDEIITELVRAASYAPSGGNLQQWRVVIVTDRDQLAAIGPVWRRSWSDFTAAVPPLPDATDDFARRQLPQASELADNLDGVPALAVFCHHWKIIGFTDADLARPSVVGGASLYPAIQNFLLACRAHGLGAVLTTTVCVAEAELAEILELPDGVGVHAAVPFGYPEGAIHGPLERRPPSKLAYRDRWGTAWTSDTR